MLYWKVKPNYDNIPVYSIVKGNPKIIRVLIQNELLTETERSRYGIPYSVVKAVDVPQNNTYFFFGARFELR